MVRPEIRPKAGFAQGQDRHRSCLNSSWLEDIGMSAYRIEPEHALDPAVMRETLAGYAATNKAVEVERQRMLAPFWPAGTCPRFERRCAPQSKSLACDESGAARRNPNLWPATKAALRAAIQMRAAIQIFDPSRSPLLQ